MKASKKKDKDPQISKDENEESFGDIADLVSESLSEASDRPQDPFDLYVLRVRRKIHSEPQGYKKRVGNGYRVLIEELWKTT